MIDIPTITSSIVNIILIMIRPVKQFIITQFGSPMDSIIFTALSFGLGWLLVSFLVNRTRTIAWSVLIISITYLVLFNII